MMSVHTFRTLVGIRSGPVAFVGLRPESSLISLGVDCNVWHSWDVARGQIGNAGVLVSKNTVILVIEDIGFLCGIRYFIAMVITKYTDT